MFDTMTLTKAGGALCGSLLVFLLIGWAGSSLYSTSVTPHAGAEGKEAHAAQAYTIETGGAGEAAPAEGAADVNVADLVASADVAAGEKIFGKCKSCHKIDGTNGTGPHLNDVVGRAIGTVADFAGYSEGMKSHGGTWDEATLFAFLKAPKEFVPGTKMTFAGLPKPEDRANVIAYLKSLEK
ncbi:MAG: cytochrome c family protein [Rhodobacteraceae bacterium]|nr:cytochrome c family protein [Paracoccaceae bacterium]